MLQFSSVVSPTLSPYQWTHTTTILQPFNGLFSRTTWVSRYQKGKTNLDFTGARDSELQWHQLGHMQACTSPQTDNHASTLPLCFLQAGCPSCRPTNSVKALKALLQNKGPTNQKLGAGVGNAFVCLFEIFSVFHLLNSRWIRLILTGVVSATKRVRFWDIAHAVYAWMNWLDSRCCCWLRLSSRATTDWCPQVIPTCLTPVARELSYFTRTSHVVARGVISSLLVYSMSLWLA